MTKRIAIIAWMFCGLIAVAMFPGGLADTENTWGIMTLSLLAPGLLGLMLSGMLLGHMPSVGSNAISVAALIVVTGLAVEGAGAVIEHGAKVSLLRGAKGDR